MNAQDIISLVRELVKLPKETEWVEFKKSYADPEEIGEYISALGNSAALREKPFAYLIWGVEDETHKIVGTKFDPEKTKVKKEELEHCLLRQLDPQHHFRFISGEVDGCRIVILEIQSAIGRPIRFKGESYIRIGSYKKQLRNHPQKESNLWRILQRTPFEEGLAIEQLAADDVLKVLDYSALFDLLKTALPDGLSSILNVLRSERLVRHEPETDSWSVTNLGAILFAKRLTDFPSLKRKAVRVTVYGGKDRTSQVARSQDGAKGYASGFEGLIGYINGLLPSNEVIRQALRETVPVYPELAVRELVANALVHQDFSLAGTGPTVDIFSDRMEIVNPGEPLVPPNRFLDNTPVSRNETLAALMRRCGICEEQGSGIDKVARETEFYQLPAPAFEESGQALRAVLFAPQALSRMGKEDRIRTTYLHACLKRVNRDYLTNQSVRERFAIQPQNAAKASRLIKEAVTEGAIAPYDRDAAPKLMKYVPWWAIQD